MSLGRLGLVIAAVLCAAGTVYLFANDRALLAILVGIPLTIACAALASITGRSR